MPAKKPAHKKTGIDLQALVGRARAGLPALTEAEVIGDDEVPQGALQTVTREPVVVDPADPGFHAALAAALVEHGDPDSACASIGCSFADYFHASNAPEFRTLYDQMVYAKVDLPGRMAVRKALTAGAMEGNGYIAKVLHDTRQQDASGADDQKLLTDMLAMERRILANKIERQIRRMIGSLEILRAQKVTLEFHEIAVVVAEEVSQEVLASDISQPYERDTTPSAS